MPYIIMSLKFVNMFITQISNFYKFLLFNLLYLHNQNF